MNPHSLDIKVSNSKTYALLLSAFPIVYSDKRVRSIKRNDFFDAKGKTHKPDDDDETRRILRLSFFPPPLKTTKTTSDPLREEVSSHPSYSTSWRHHHHHHLSIKNSSSSAETTTTPQQKRSSRTGAPRGTARMPCSTSASTSSRASRCSETKKCTPF